jgi:hypothetical protein
MIVTWHWIAAVLFAISFATGLTRRYHLWATRPPVLFPRPDCARCGSRRFAMGDGRDVHRWCVMCGQTQEGMRPSR